MNTVLITAVGSFSADRIIRNLKKAGVRTVGCDIYPREWIASAADVSSFYQVPRADDTENYRNALLEICRREKVDYIFPLTDVEVDVWQECRARWEHEEGAAVCISPYEAIHICRNKDRIVRFIEKNAVEIQTIPTSCLEELEQEPECFPIVCKPCNGRSSQGLYKIEDRDEWRFFRSRKHSERYIVQPFLEGDVVTVDVVRNPATEEAIAVPRKEFLRTPNGAGTSVLVFSDPQLEEKCRRLAGLLHITGCVNFEFLQDPDGNYYFLECNPRFSGGTAFTCLAGFDCVTAHLKCFTGEKLGSFSLPREMYIARKYKEYII